MSQPANIEATLEERARAARRAQRELLMRQLKSLLHADDLDIGRTYTEILQELQVLVAAELQAVQQEQTQAAPTTQESAAVVTDTPDAT